MLIKKSVYLCLPPALSTETELGETRCLLVKRNMFLQRKGVSFLFNYFIIFMVSDLRTLTVDMALTMPLVI